MKNKYQAAPHVSTEKKPSKAKIPDAEFRPVEKHFGLEKEAP